MANNEDNNQGNIHIPPLVFVPKNGDGEVQEAESFDLTNAIFSSLPNAVGETGTTIPQNAEADLDAARARFEKNLDALNTQEINLQADANRQIADIDNNASINNTNIQNELQRTNSQLLKQLQNDALEIADLIDNFGTPAHQATATTM